MTTYYVSSENGDDADAGTSVGTAFKTLTQVCSVMGAGDVAYFEAGHYPDNAITFSASGADENNRIKFIGDVKGDYFSSKGAISWTAITAPYTNRPVQGNSNVITFTGNFIHLENINSFGGSYTANEGIYFTESHGNYFYRCTFGTVGRNVCLKLDYSLHTSDVAYDTTFESCIFMSLGCYILTPKLLSQYDLNLYFKNCLGLPSQQFSATGGAVYPSDVAATGTLAISGIRMYHCTGVGGYFLKADGIISATFGANCKSINSLGITAYVFNGHRAFSSEWDYPNTKSEFSLLSNNDLRPSFTEWHSFAGGFVGGYTDMEYYRKFGASPFQMHEPYHTAQKETFVVGAGSTGGNCARDIYGIRRGNSPRTWLYGHFNGATSITDPDSAWNIEANAFTWSRTATGGTLSSAQGTDSTNHVIGIGMDPEKLMNDDGVIHAVKMLITAKNDGYSGWPYATADVGFKVISGAETLYNSSWTLDIPSEDEWQTQEISLSVPTGGWTHAKILALEVRFWQNDVHTSRVSMDSVLIRYQVSGTDTPGCVQSYQRPVADAVEQYLSNDTVVLTGAGMQQILLPCPTAASYIITAPYKFDANYTGTKPILEVKGMVGQDMQTDTATGSSGSWNTDLAVTVTPTEAGFVCVQVYSLDTSGIAECWFGQVSIAAV